MSSRLFSFRLLLLASAASPQVRAAQPPRVSAIRFLLAVVAVGFALSVSLRDCRAAWTFIGPTPYLSTADSPFPLSDSNATFFLEDFEPDPNCVPSENTFCIGDFDTPGARLVYGGIGRFDSVDGDDGLIDGSGAAGFSGVAFTRAIIGSSRLVTFEVEFDSQHLGFLPTAVGFVVTDGAGEGSGLGVYDALGNRHDFLTSDIEVEPISTRDDRFIGVINPNGISRIEFNKRIFDANATAPPRIDHFQYGLAVPEPGVLSLLFSFVVFSFGVRVWIGWRRYRIFSGVMNVSESSKTTSP